jgi:hypothetical protein
MKTLVILLICLPQISLATSGLSLMDFQGSKAYQYVSVVGVEKVFSDELTQEDIYKVSFTVDTDNCAPSGEIDYCEQSEPMCEYAFVDTSYATLSPEDIQSTGVSCDQDIEEVLEPQLIDEL